MTTRTQGTEHIPSLVDHVSAGNHHHLQQALRHPDNFTQEELNEALYVAASRVGDVHATKMLLSYGADMKHLNDKGAAILFGVVIASHIEILRCLLEFGYDVNYGIENSSETGLGIPLHIAIWKNDIEMVKMLIEAKCKLDYLDNEGNNALHTTCMAGSLTILELLLPHTSIDNIDLQNNQGESPLNLAVKHYHPQVIQRMLLLDGVNVNCKNYFGETPLLMAAKLNLIDIIELFLECQNCDVNHANQDGSTVIHMIAPYADERLLEKCISHNVKLNTIDKCGNTVLTVAACYKNEILLQYLMSKHGYQSDNNMVESADWMKLKGFLGRGILHWVVMNGMTRMLAVMLETTSLDIDVQDEEGNTPLLLATKHKGFNEFAMLLKAGANPDIADGCGFSPLHCICASGYSDMLNLLLLFQPSFEKLTFQSESALLLAVKNNHMDIVELLFNYAQLEFKQMLDIIDSLQQTVLHHAVVNERPEIVQLLISKGCSRLLNYKDNNQATALLIATKNERKDILEIFLRHEAEVNIQDCELKSPLFYMVCHSDNNGVRMLLEAGADPDLDQCGSTSLIQASKNGNFDIMEMLIQHKADVEHSDKYNRTAFIWACQRGHLEIARFLLSKACDPKHVDISGDTALTTAAFEGHKDVVEFLLPVSYVDHAEYEEGMTALLLALSATHSDIAALLIQHNADVNLFGQNGNSVLITAVANECGLETVKLLLSTDRLKDINTVGEMGRTVSHWGVSDPEILQLVLNSEKHQLEFNSTDDNGATPLLLAIAHSKPQSAVSLINAGCTCDMVHSDGRQPIHHASIYGEVSVLKCLLQRGVSVNTLTTDQRSPLLLACIEGHTDCVQLLIAGGAFVNEVYFDAITPLSVAVNGSHYATMDLLLQSGAYPDLIGSKKPRPLICSIVKDDIRSVKTLLQWGADVEICTDVNSHPVTVAALKHREAVLNLLLSTLADTNVVRRTLKEGAIYYFIRNKSITDLLQKYIQSPVTLQQICREVVRKYIHLPKKINMEKLPVPIMIRHYLLFIEQTQDESGIGSIN